MYVCVYACTYVCSVCMHVYIYIYIYISRICVYAVRGVYVMIFMCTCIYTQLMCICTYTQQFGCALCRNGSAVS